MHWLRLLNLWLPTMGSQMLHKTIQWKPKSQRFVAVKYYSYENKTIECKLLIEANTLSDNISHIFIESFHTLTSTSKPFASDNGKPRRSQK